MGIIELLLGVIFATAVAFGIVLGAMSGASNAEVWVARGCFSVAAICVAAAFFFWAFQQNKSIGAMVAIGVLAGVWIFVGFPLQLRWIDYRNSQDQAPAPLLASQIEELKKLGDFLNGYVEITKSNNEESLRRLFDFPQMLSNNLWLWRQIMGPSSVSSEKATELDKYFQGGIIAVDPRYVAFTTASNGAIVVNMIQGKIGYIKYSPKFLEGKNKLFEFNNSIQSPSNIRKLTADLLKIVDDDANLMTEVFNEQYSENVNNLIGDQDGNSPYLGRTTNRYWSRFTPLKPTTDEILESIRKYLKVDR